MKKFKPLLLVWTLIMIFGCAGCGAKEEKTDMSIDTQESTNVTAETEKKELKVTLIVAGSFGDHSFYDGARAGAERLIEDGIASVQYIECGNEGYDERLREAAAGADMVLAVGWEFEHIGEIAAEYPDVKFIWPDGEVENQPSNLLCMTYAQNEGAFLAGYLAASLSESGKIALVGGIENEVIREFQAGYEQGAVYADPDCQVLDAYIGDFLDKNKAKSLALSLTDQDCDVLFHAAGVAGMGVFEAAAERGCYAIGVDSDQKYLDEEHIVASVVKDIGNSLYDTVEDYRADGTFEGGTARHLNLKTGYIGIGYGEEGSQQQVDDDLKAKVEETAELIRSGEIIVKNALPVIGISMHTSSSERWIRDGETLKAELEEEGYNVALTFTDGGDQTAQIDELLEQNIKVLVVAADDPAAIGPALEKAAGQGVKVLAYDRMPMNTDAVDAIATFDSREVGRLQGERVLSVLLQRPGGQDIDAPVEVEILGGDRNDPNAHWVLEGVLETLAPYIKSGEIADPGQADDLLSDSWSKESGYDRTKALLDEGRTPDAILCGSDNILVGCIEAIQDRDNLPNLIMMGQDAILDISHHISAAKDRTATVFKDSRLLAKRAAELADILARGVDMPTADDTLDNGNKAVNAYFAPLQTVDFFNYRTALIDSGYYTAAELKAEPDELITREEVLAQLFTFEDNLITDTEGFALETEMAGEVFPGKYLNIDDHPTVGDTAATYMHYCINNGLLDEERKELPYTNLAEIPNWILESLEFCNYYGLLDWVEGDQILFDSPITRLEAEQMYLGLVEAVMNQYDDSMRTEEM